MASDQTLNAPAPPTDRNCVFLIPNELSLPRLLLSTLLGKRLVLLPSAPIINRLGAKVDAICGWFIRKGFAESVFDRHPALRPYLDSEFYAHRTDMFARTEAWLSTYFKFSEAESRLGVDARPYFHLVCLYISRRYAHVQIVYYLEQQDEGRVVGMDPEAIALFRAYYGTLPRFHTKPSVRLTAAVNLIVWLAFMGFGLAWIAARLGHSNIARTRHLGCDFVGDPRDINLWKAVLGQKPEEVLVVLRNPGQEELASSKLAPFSWTTLGRDKISLGVAAGLIQLLLSRSAVLTPYMWHLPPGLFYSLAALPARRIAFRLFFKFNRFRFFWGRDDYNVEHIVRSQELRRIGGQSIGISHGLPAVSIVTPLWRYLDFDIYYVFGRHLYKTYYSDTWPSQMKVTPVGSFGVLDPSMVEAVGESRDIMVLASIDSTNHHVVDTVLKLAKAFPERRILVKIKHRRAMIGRDIIEPLKQAPTNVEICDGDFYALLSGVGYVFGGTTTAVAEAIQFRRFAFALDFYERDKPFYYRDFPDMVVTSAEMAILRIQDIELGAWRYPRENFAELIELEPEPLAQVFARDLDLNRDFLHA